MQRFGMPLIGVPVVLLFLWYFKPVFWPAYNTNHPDYNWLSKSLGEREIDLARLNEGDWQTACVFGGYNDPVVEMRRLGISVRAGDVIRLWRYRGFPIRLDAVEEDETAVAYVDNAGFADFILLPNPAVDLQHFRGCIKRPETFLSLT
jgi:hypothetical protein